MPTLAPPALAIPSAPLDGHPLAGRLQPTLSSSPPRIAAGSLADYTLAFGLDLAALRGRDVLDVGAGQSSFVAEACARRIDAVAVDPLYGRSAVVPPGTEHAASTLPAEASVNGGFLARVGHGIAAGGRAPGGAGAGAAEPDRRTAEERFADDYQFHYAHGRYVAGALPQLPFFDGTFDLVLGERLLFVGRTSADFDWHLAACREMVRVTAGEVRIFPLGAAGGPRFAGLSRLRRDLREFGILAEIRASAPGVAHRGSGMLVLQRSSS